MLQDARPREISFLRHVTDDHDSDILTFREAHEYGGAVADLRGASHRGFIGRQIHRLDGIDDEHGWLFFFCLRNDGIQIAAGIDEEIVISGAESFGAHLDLCFGLFGMGCDITGITVSKIVTKWFRGKELASAMGTQVAMARLGTALAFSLSPVLVQHFGVTSPLAIGAGILLFGFVLFMVYCLFDRKFDALSSASTSNTDNSDDVFRFADFVTVVRNVGFWLIAIVCVLYYASIRTFMNFATDFMVNGFAIDKEMAGWVVSLIPFGAIVLSPLFGILYDRTGRGTQMMTIGCVVLTVSLLLLNYPLTHALWYVLSMMTLVGIAFSLVPAALWPTVPMMVPLKQLGTAYSIIYYIQNLGLFLVPIWIGKVVDAYTTPSGIDYTIPMLIFIILSIGSMLTAIGLLRITKE